MNVDVFSSILCFIPDTKTIYTVLDALPKSHELFPTALARLWQLPICLDAWDAQTCAISLEVVDFLLHEDPNHESLAKSIRHLVVCAEREPLPPRYDDDYGGYVRHMSLIYTTSSPAAVIDWDLDVRKLYEKLPSLFRGLRNLQSLDYHTDPGSSWALSGEHAEALRHLRRFNTLAVDCALRSRETSLGEILAAVTDGAERKQLDTRSHSLDPFLSSIGPTLSSLELRHINQSFLALVVDSVDSFSSYHALEHLKVDITKVVWAPWGWDGGQSPFTFLGFPSVTRLDLIVSDEILFRAARSRSQTGPLDMVHCHLLTELTIDVRHSTISWMASRPYYQYESTIELFKALSPSEFPILSRLEIKDNARNTTRHFWNNEDNRHRREQLEPGRYYTGLVPRFLGAISSGFLPKLRDLWVDEKILFPPYWANKAVHVQNLFDPDKGLHPEYIVWEEVLRATFRKTQTLRVGFGPMNHVDAKLVLDICNPDILKQFGFEWNWKYNGRKKPLSPQLLEQFSRFPKLTDVHILFPRPGFIRPGRPDPTVNARTYQDVKSIFSCNERICRVGIGNSVVWERHPNDPAEILLVSDGSVAPNSAVPKFYHAGYMARAGVEAPDSDNAASPRPRRKEEIGRLRDLLERILT
ncbi:hypothetical protein R3P38DRAFT_3165944 [Favolaschia claudopus]|uniref:Uncharacterized protein n=1 Tax=Favolaschia claudopus TaxID=2862362 RepID=A0AAW0EHL1_9AGAR